VPFALAFISFILNSFLVNASACKPGAVFKHRQASPIKFLFPFNRFNIIYRVITFYKFLFYKKSA